MGFKKHVNVIKESRRLRESRSLTEADEDAPEESAAGGYRTEAVAEQIRAKLPELESEVSKLTGLKVKLEVEFNPESRGRRERISMESQNLVDQMDMLGREMYDEFTFESFGGGEINEDKGLVWFNPHFSWHFTSGGSNGTDALWRSLWFDIENDKWIYGDRLR